MKIRPNTLYLLADGTKMYAGSEQEVEIGGRLALHEEYTSRRGYWDTETGAYPINLSLSKAPSMLVVSLYY